MFHKFIFRSSNSVFLWLLMLCCSWGQLFDTVGSDSEILTKTCFLSCFISSICKYFVTRFLCVPVTTWYWSEIMFSNVKLVSFHLSLCDRMSILSASFALKGHLFIPRLFVMHVNLTASRNLFSYYCRFWSHTLMLFILGKWGIIPVSVQCSVAVRVCSMTWWFTIKNFVFTVVSELCYG